MENTIKSLPMVALRGMTIMPEMVVHFDVAVNGRLLRYKKRWRKNKRFS